MKRILKNAVKSAANRLLKIVSRIVDAGIGTSKAVEILAWTRFLNDRYVSEQFLAEPIENLLRDLKQGLDPESIYQVERYFRRILFRIIAAQVRFGYTFDVMKPAYDDREIHEMQELGKLALASKETPYPSSFHNLYDGGLSFVPEPQRQRIKSFDIIDGGAFIGDSVPSFLKYEPSRIFCFEPDESNFAALSNNKKKYGWNDIFPIKSGLGKQRETLSLYGGRGMASSTVTPTNKQTND